MAKQEDKIQVYEEDKTFFIPDHNHPQAGVGITLGDNDVRFALEIAYNGEDDLVINMVLHDLEEDPTIGLFFDDCDGQSDNSLVQWIEWLLHEMPRLRDTRHQVRTDPQMDLRNMITRNQADFHKAARAAAKRWLGEYLVQNFSFRVCISPSYCDDLARATLQAKFHPLGQEWHDFSFVCRRDENAHIEDDELPGYIRSPAIV